MSDHKERKREYAHFEIDLPLTSHPFSALKSHNLQFGGCLGLLFAVVASSVPSGLAISSLSVLGLGLWSVGFTTAGKVRSPEPEDTIGTTQIRYKPHYFLTPMTALYLLGLWIF